MAIVPPSHQKHRPVVVLVSKLQSKDADAWIDLVQDDMEALGYAVRGGPVSGCERRFSAHQGPALLGGRLLKPATANLDGRLKRTAPLDRRLGSYRMAGHARTRTSVKGAADTQRRLDQQIASPKWLAGQWLERRESSGPKRRLCSWQAGRCTGRTRFEA